MFKNRLLPLIILLQMLVVVVGWRHWAYTALMLVNSPLVLFVQGDPANKWRFFLSGLFFNSCHIYAMFLPLVVYLALAGDRNPLNKIELPIAVIILLAPLAACYAYVPIAGFQMASIN